MQNQKYYQIIIIKSQNFIYVFDITNIHWLSLANFVLVSFMHITVKKYICIKGLMLPIR